MRVMKFAVALCFTVALVTLGNYPHPDTVHGAAPEALPRFTYGLGSAYTYTRNVSSPICINCHQTINHMAFVAQEGNCETCHSTGSHGFVAGISAYHNSFPAQDGSCRDCHTRGAEGWNGFAGSTSANHKSFWLGLPKY